MGRRLIEVAELLVDHVHKAGYQHRVLEDSIHEERQKRIAAEKDRDHWRAARQDAMQAGELMQAEIEKLRAEVESLKNRRAAVQRIIERIEQLSNVSIGDAEACIESVHQIRKYFDPNEYPVLKGGE